MAPRYGPVILQFRSRFQSRSFAYRLSRINSLKFSSNAFLAARSETGGGFLNAIGAGSPRSAFSEHQSSISFWLRFALVPGHTQSFGFEGSPSGSVLRPELLLSQPIENTRKSISGMNK